MTVCPNCGIGCGDELRFCQSCGCPLRQARVPASGSDEARDLTNTVIDISELSADSPEGRSMADIDITDIRDNSPVSGGQGFSPDPAALSGEQLRGEYAVRNICALCMILSPSCIRTFYDTYEKVSGNIIRAEAAIKERQEAAERQAAAERERAVERAEEEELSREDPDADSGSTAHSCGYWAAVIIISIVISVALSGVPLWIIAVIYLLIDTRRNN